jgi:hypothetical protein
VNLQFGQRWANRFGHQPARQCIRQQQAAWGDPEASPHHPVQRRKVLSRVQSCKFHAVLRGEFEEVLPEVRIATQQYQPQSAEVAQRNDFLFGQLIVDAQQNALLLHKQPAMGKGFVFRRTAKQQIEIAIQQQVFQTVLIVMESFP